jgi:hypothetical protein
LPTRRFLMLYCNRAAQGLIAAHVAPYFANSLVDAWYILTT